MRILMGQSSDEQARETRTDWSDFACCDRVESSIMMVRRNLNKKRTSI